jgi:TetR/AcrR family transcriptional regulator, transcriptional repressor for nem operon
MTRRQPPAARRRAILDAAASLLVTRGLAGTSVDAVARRAGIAKGTVYLYFASRSDLLAALRSRYAQGLADRAGSVLDHADPADPGSVTGAFERLAAELLGYVHAHQRLYHVLFHEAPGHQDQPGQPLQHLVARLLSQAMDQGALTPTDPGVLARFLLDGLHGAMLPLAHQSQPRVPASIGEILCRLLAPARPATHTITKGPAQP